MSVTAICAKALLPVEIGRALDNYPSLDGNLDVLKLLHDVMHIEPDQLNQMLKEQYDEGYGDGYRDGENDFECFEEHV